MTLNYTTMKKTILSIAIAAVLASCSNNKPAEQASVNQSAVNADTIGLSDYKEWKQKQELQTQQTYTSPGVNEIAPEVEEAPAVEAKPKTIIVYRDAPVKQSRVAKTSRSSSRPVYKAPEPENPGIAKAPTPTNPGSKRETYGRGTTGTEGTAGSGASTSGEGNGDVASTPAPAEVPAKNEGWSKAAKGGAIGGASGAVIGAVISKNKTKGAVIGGIVGAAGGYIFGRKQDKKDGRN
jgi:hypothetical protein